MTKGEPTRKIKKLTKIIPDPNVTLIGRDDMFFINSDKYKCTTRSGLNLKMLKKVKQFCKFIWMKLIGASILLWW